MGCDQVRLLLEERVGACRGEVGRLEAELERIAGMVGARQEELARLTTALEVVAALPLAHPGVVAAEVPVRVSPAGRASARADAAAGFSARVLAVLRSGPADGMRCREAAHAGLDLSVCELIHELAGIQETVLLYRDGGKGRPRAQRLLTDMDDTQRRLAELFDVTRHAPTR